MFCTQCGRPAQPEHVFCAGCGTRLVRDGAAPFAQFAAGAVTQPEAPPPPPQASVQPWTGEDWRETSNYRMVIGHPEVKALVAEAAKANKAGPNAEEVMKALSQIFPDAGASSEATKLIADLGPALYAKIGVKTGKDARNGYATSFGRTLAAILCSMASRNQRLVAVHEGKDGCIIEADVPSSVSTFAGKLSLTLERKPEGTLVSSAVVFPGAAADWGRSKRILDDLHQDILNYRTLQP